MYVSQQKGVKGLIAECKSGISRVTATPSLLYTQYAVHSMVQASLCAYFGRGLWTVNGDSNFTP